MAIPRLLALFIIVIGFVGCNKSTEDPNILINIENEFTISMLETLNSATNPINLVVTTVDPLECTNYEIIHSHSIISSSVHASIDYLREPEDCNPGTVQATSNIQLGRLANGVYEFQLNLEKSSIINNGTLVINDQSYSIELETEYGIDFPLKRLNKIPNGYFWGTINLAPDGDENIPEDLLEELAQASNLHTLTAGNYGYFDIENDLSIKLKSDNILPFNPIKTTSFIFSLEGDKTSIKTILDNYRNNYEGEFDIQLVTSEGESL